MAILSELEARCYRSNGASFDGLLSLLLSLEGNDPELSVFHRCGDLTGSDACLNGVEEVATRVLALAGTLLLNEQLILDDQRFLALFIRMNSLQAVATVSGFGGTDHLLRALGVRDSKTLLELARRDRQSFLKALMLLSLDTQVAFDIEPLLQAEPKLGSLVYFRLLSSGRVLSSTGEESRERLLRAADLLQPYIPKDLNYLVLLANTWMMCSYAEFPGKHRIKVVLNRYLRKWMAELGLHDRVFPGPKSHNDGVQQDKAASREPDLSKGGEICEERATSSGQPSAPSLEERPCLVVAAEVIHSNHVQYRYFGQYIRQLKTGFRLVLIAESSQVDAHVQALFDEVLIFERGSSVDYLKGLRDLIVSAQPEIIFWLSVGMRHWGVALANLRLAPVQFAGFGHGAYTFCETIDFYLTEEGYVAQGAGHSTTVISASGVETRTLIKGSQENGSINSSHSAHGRNGCDSLGEREATGGIGGSDLSFPEIRSERLLLLPDESLKFERSPHYTDIKLRNNRETNSAGGRNLEGPSRRSSSEADFQAIHGFGRPQRTIVAAVPSNLLKLNCHFIETLRAIQVASEARGRDLHFKFFPNQRGLQFALTQRLLERYLKRAFVVPMLRYQAYMEELSYCHVNFSSFPFGSVHSVMDSLRLGLPVVVMEAVEPHARADAMLLRRLCMPEWLICRRRDDYVASAVRLVSDDHLRESLSELALERNVDQTMFGDGTTPLRGEVVRAVEWAYAHRSALSTHSQWLFRPGEW